LMKRKTKKTIKNENLISDTACFVALLPQNIFYYPL